MKNVFLSALLLAGMLVFAACDKKADTKTDGKDKTEEAGKKKADAPTTVTVDAKALAEDVCNCAKQKDPKELKTCSEALQKLVAETRAGIKDETAQMEWDLAYNEAAAACLE